MPEKKATQQQIVAELKKSYFMEIETVINYLANSIHLDGIRAEEIRKALAADVQEELTHAQTLARRIKVLGSGIPGSLDLTMEQKSLQPPRDLTDVVSVIKGVMEAEQGAIEQYTKLIEMCDGIDWVTQDICIQLMGDEQEHLRLFKGYLTEYSKKEVKA
ncbi:MAG TPA: ferritin-like domain-containing protein [Candidatus Sumerlaeota bacterium]|nr:MAG: Ferritin-like domain protein [candidate division BRC1 bacterium ADurb.BinA292]HOE97368.1 ferritin-like domain-containing protein [Candidatus Sumerlaeota bacterium]HOR27971.1 ferritin-like domain-containing protein [Candidatus Sumerlaeota bacterium]HPK01777.1 ferritin-like domain-containing protein [Candidatus Sumerlaeota bacterium]